jgi:hypothetical protein
VQYTISLENDFPMIRDHWPDVYDHLVKVYVCDSGLFEEQLDQCK